ECAPTRRLPAAPSPARASACVGPSPEGPRADTRGARARLTAAFESAYREKFALTPPGVPVEFLNIRVAARAPVAGAGVVLAGRGAGGRRAARQGVPAGVLPPAGGVLPPPAAPRH